MQRDMVPNTDRILICATPSLLLPNLCSYFSLFISFIHTYMATCLHSDRDVRLFCPLPFSAYIVSVVLVTYCFI